MVEENNSVKIFETSASALVLDLRGSTELVVKAKNNGILKQHVEFMLNTQKILLDAIFELGDKDKFYYNDTGDGFLCVFWDDNHAITNLKVGLFISHYLELATTTFLKKFKNIYGVSEFKFGLGFHTGTCFVGSFIHDDPNRFSRKYIYGTLANSTARLESFSKNYIYDNILLTAHFRDLFLAQVDKIFPDKSEFFLSTLENQPCLGEVNLKDFQEEGHWVFSLGTESVNEILKIFKLHRFTKYHENDEEKS